MKVINEKSAPAGAASGGGSRLFFSASEWAFHPGISSNVGEKIAVNNFLGRGIEGYSIGDWNNNWTEIGTMQLPLKKNTEFTFSFWLNGGENDISDETCQLNILFDNNYENRLVFRLNRGFTAPVKQVKGWYLYEIVFKTENNRFTQLRFVACRAPMAILPAKEKAFYANTPAEIPPTAPQRSNIVFPDGYPHDAVWSSSVFSQINK